MPVCIVLPCVTASTKTRLARAAPLSAVLSIRDTRTRLTHREFVIATGHHSGSRTAAPKSLILGPRREIRSRSVSSGEPLFWLSRTSVGWRLTRPHRSAHRPSYAFPAELRAVALIGPCRFAFSACSHTERGTGGHRFRTLPGRERIERVNTGTPSKLACLRARRWRIENQISIWLIHEA